MKRRPHSDILDDRLHSASEGAPLGSDAAFAPEKPDPRTLGRRAARLRELLGRSVEDVAHQVGVSPAELRRFEQTGDARLQLLVGLLEALTPGGYLDHAFETPRFTSIQEVVEFEQRRTSRR